MRSIVVLALSVALAACATAPGKVEVVAGQPDTARFKVYTVVGVPETEADQRVVPQFEDYRQAHGYRSYAVLGRTWNYLPTYFEYTVRFEK